MGRSPLYLSYSFLLVVALGSGLGNLLPSVDHSRDIFSAPALPTTPAAAPELRQVAQAITIKLWVADNNWGSGVIIAHRGDTYTVLTNRHVLNAGNQYQIQTSDGLFHTVTVLANQPEPQRDLALVEFTSSITYAVATPSTSPLSLGEPVLAAGYAIADDPSQPAGFITANGEVAILTEQPMLSGYQIGTTIPLAKGMSGGPLLNNQGEVVGINGMHQYPIWGNPYVFADGAIADVATQYQFSQYSWAIPNHILQSFLQTFIDPFP
jgi:S1-C subfamily serine protease